VLRTVLNPASPLFREARYLLEEGADVRDTALYHSVLAAVVNGNGTRGGIATYIGRRAADIGRHPNVLEDCGLLRREPDVFRPGRSRYRITEPLITFYQVVMRPQWGLLESGQARPVWQDATARFSAQVLGPHFRAAVPGVRPGHLRRARDLLTGRGYDTRDTVLTCYSGAGFDPDLSSPGDRVLAVDLDDLYAEARSE
jgi:hypothetical protein